MDTIENHRQIIKQLLTEYAQIPTTESGIENKTLFDSENDRYMLISLGWSQEKRIHYCIIHLDIIAGKIWIQANNTDCLIAEELVAAGIPAKSIVLGMQLPEVRPYTAYGVGTEESDRLIQLKSN
ncbi:MAG: XisI protein [Okeania sp. SIO2C9]|uniref:XisI protein n=1 Tax=Okeania sp. SIO2C9 TaxID=2607791 RepID=UPI0013C24F13|nr:XisI protein [Okeania sp. SIO2C9]NEQ73224.1 XisI protein [Okeania sp. SIO2C9]